MAKYKGKTQYHAKRVLDASQNGKSHPKGHPGHPRGHAPDPQAKGPTESVENYSKHSDGEDKTGFLSRSDQDKMVHLRLNTIEAQDAMELMNEEGESNNKEALHILTEKLRINEKKIPKAQTWLNGKKFGKPWKIKKLTLVLKHHYKKYNDDNEDVFVLTAYPEP
ncbi:hypothetical protein QAD02_015947 [Eretmocerus hayati]|uniref:Uncharacterized protein n=1 Tax=Eretmocerus hayati TaxID=131215 RepID=A0ACC2PEF8_9HYME|nr:hypothetical protein QAD02_015947 [Eretmocerus hayati]